jgi:hypothetical protein
MTLPIDDSRRANALRAGPLSLAFKPATKMTRPGAPLPARQSLVQITGDSEHVNPILKNAIKVSGDGLGLTIFSFSYD